MNEQIRELEEKLIDMLNQYNLVPIEAKRLIIKPYNHKIVNTFLLKFYVALYKLLNTR